jgi:hypothetical protein
MALREAPAQERFVGSMRAALADAAGYPHANPWHRPHSTPGYRTPAEALTGHHRGLVLQP